MPTIDPITTARKLVENLESFYKSYTKAIRKMEEEETTASVFGAMFGGSRGIVRDRIHDEFYQSVKKRCDLLSVSLENAAGEHPEEVHQLAKKTVDILLQPIPDRFRDVGGWMRFAAEPLSAPFLKWLTRQELTAIRTLYVETYPKRKMFKPQKELLAEMDRLLR